MTVTILPVILSNLTSIILLNHSYMNYKNVYNNHTLNSGYEPSTRSILGSECNPFIRNKTPI